MMKLFSDSMLVAPQSNLILSIRLCLCKLYVYVLVAVSAAVFSGLLSQCEAQHIHTCIKSCTNQWNAWSCDSKLHFLCVRNTILCMHVFFSLLFWSWLLLFPLFRPPACAFFIAPPPLFVIPHLPPAIHRVWRRIKSSLMYSNKSKFDRCGIINFVKLQCSLISGEAHCCKWQLLRKYHCLFSTWMSNSVSWLKSR